MMNHTARTFFEQLNGKKVAFLGIGVSHRELIKLFAKKGAVVYACDRREREEFASVAEELEGAGATLCLGEHYMDGLSSMDIVFRTPGMNYLMPELQELIRNGVVVTSEMEVFFDLCPCKIYAVTGSDGKTTTTTLIAKILEKAGKKVYLGGNIGKALLPVVEEIGDDDAAVVELSSFQLISMRKSPDVAVITNISPNHLDIHKDMQEYTSAKNNILMHQTAFGRAVLNEDNEASAMFRPSVRGDLYTFSRKKEDIKGAYCDEKGDIRFRDHGQEYFIMNKREIKIPGEHNVENLLAAICAVWGAVTHEAIVEVAKEFTGVEHRIELVRELNGVRWYNDSIATSPTRMIAGLNSFDQKLIVIAGGYDKHIPFLPMGPAVIEKVKILILMGATADKIEETVKSTAGYKSSGIEIVRVESMEQAVKEAFKAAKPGDIITLSPACASFDRYPNFEERGRHYKSLVKELS